MRKDSLIIVMSVSLVLFLSIFAASADNPLVGTWKMNVEKSKFSPGPAPKSETWKIEAQENGQKDTFDGVGADGKAYHEEAAPKYDGKDYPITGAQDADTVALKRIDPNTIEFVLKKAGKEVSKGRATVSKDGKTLTETAKGKNAQGQETSANVVYDIQ